MAGQNGGLGERPPFGGLGRERGGLLRGRPSPASWIRHEVARSELQRRSSLSMVFLPPHPVVRCGAVKSGRGSRAGARGSGSGKEARRRTAWRRQHCSDLPDPAVGSAMGSQVGSRMGLLVSSGFFLFFYRLNKAGVVIARIRLSINRGGQGNRLHFSRINLDLLLETVAFARLR